MDIARALAKAGLERAGRENPSFYRSFLQFERDCAVRALARLDEMNGAMKSRCSDKGTLNCRAKGKTFFLLRKCLITRRFDRAKTPG